MSIEDALIRRQVFIQRFSGSQAMRAEQMLESLYANLIVRLLRSTTDFQQGRLTILLNDIETLLDRGFIEIGEFISDEALVFAEAETLFSQGVIQSNSKAILGTPAIAQIEQAVLMSGMDVPIGANSLTLSEAIAAFKDKKMIDITLIINNGILTGETTQQITKNITTVFGSKHKAQVNTLVRTSINHASSMARATISAQNAALLKGEEWVATLDSNTTLICGGRDGRIFPVGVGPYPPAHWNCRSVRVPVVKDEFAIGSQGAKRPEISADGRGTTSSKTKFDSWLRRQPADFQDEYFSQFPDGLEKAKLFRIGKVSIDRFRDETGRDFTLEQLRALEPVAFGKANLVEPITIRPEGG